ncbi:MAG TPA: pilin [Candidatus Paceibacterota bacterium]|jgi:hypothetical protein|nr:pilin [Candidatus Paceibacterota bacterium]
MSKKLKKLGGLAAGLGASMLVPLMALAQVGVIGNNQATGCNALAGQSVSTIQGFICKLNDILTALVPFLVALGIVYFVWGVVTYVIAGDEEAKKKGRDRMIYGIIGLVVIVAVWGIVHWITNTFSVTNNGQINLPQVGY